MATTASAHGKPMAAAVKALLKGITPASASVSSGPIQIKKQDPEQQIVFGEVYAPGFPDSQGDFMTAETIRNMSYGFMKQSAMAKIDIQHDRIDCGAYVVESFIARDDDAVFIPGSWVIGVHVPDADQWALIKSGELNGFSLDGIGIRVDTELEYELPDTLGGRTLKADDGHDHEFFVFYAPDGTFLGGYTGKAADGHWHIIKSGTVTETMNDHNHRFSFAEGFLEAINAG